MRREDRINRSKLPQGRTSVHHNPAFSGVLPAAMVRIFRTWTQAPVGLRRGTIRAVLLGPNGGFTVAAPGGDEVRTDSNPRILVTGAGGFIGHHLVTSLKQRGYWVRGVDMHPPEYTAVDADEFKLRDLRRFDECLLA